MTLVLLVVGCVIVPVPELVLGEALVPVAALVSVGGFALVPVDPGTLDALVLGDVVVPAAVPGFVVSGVAAPPDDVTAIGTGAGAVGATVPPAATPFAGSFVGDPAGDDILSLGATSTTVLDGTEQIGNGAPQVGWYGGPLHICMSIQGGEP